MTRFDHQRLDVYNVAIQFVATAHGLVKRMPRGNGHLVDQLLRSATSVPLNIAEGAGEFSKPEKARFYRMARRSATECAAILDVLEVLRLAEGTDLASGREQLDRVVAMLTPMTRLDERAESGRGGLVRERPEAEAGAEAEAEQQSDSEADPDAGAY
ncbi:MAG TPA: four helix bundle protein [Longimicrobiales bacterium]|nr:four helix bundle protein [Longimicrobiales bacterium]